MAYNQAIYNNTPQCTSVAVDTGTGDIYTLSRNGGIYLNQSSTPFFSFFNVGLVGTPQSMIFALVASGPCLFITVQNGPSSGYLLRYNLGTNSNATSATKNLSTPTGIAIGGLPGNEVLYVSMFGTSQVQRFSSTDLEAIYPTFITSGLDGPQGIVIYNNDLYISSYNDNKVYRYNLLGQKDNTFTSLNTPSPTGITVQLNSQSDPYIIVAGGGLPLGFGCFEYDLNNPSTLIPFSNTPSPYGILFYNNIFYVASTTGGAGGGATYSYSYNIACFEKNTKILCLKDNEEVYVTISELKKGDLIKTYKHGLKKLELIGSGAFMNDVSDPLKSMYKHKDKVDGFDNLVVTGGHSILVDHLLEEEELKQQKIHFNFKIEDKQMSLSAFSKDFEQITTNEEFTYYHIVLENEDENGKYGIWANGGILTETCQRTHFFNVFKI